MIKSFIGELEKLSEYFDIPITRPMRVGSANARFNAAAEFLAEVNKKLGPPKKKAKKAKEE